MFDSFITLMIGLIGITLGRLVKKHKLAYIISGINLDKYDKSKLCDIVGSILMIQWVALVVLSYINYLLDIKESIIIISTVVVIIGCIICIYHRINKYARLSKYKGLNRQ